MTARAVCPIRRVVGACYSERVSRVIAALALLVGLSTTACTLSVPRKDLPYPLTDETFGDPVKVVNIPLPVIKTDPNEGVTLGALSAFLVHDKKDELRTMVVPQVNYNDNFGTTAQVFGAFYPAPGRHWEMTLSKSQHVNEDYTIKYRDRTLRDGTLDLNGTAFLSADGSARFFGFQSRSSSRDETNYDDQETVLRASLGVDLGHDFQLVLGDRFRDVEIKRGAVTSLPWIRERFTPSEVPGIGGFTTHAQLFGLVYSTLDFDGTAFLSADGSARFFGFQSRSSSRDETNYDDREILLRGSLGYDLGHDVHVVVGDRYRDVEIRRGAVTSLPWIRDRFTRSEVPGIEGFTTHAQQFGLVYTALDDLDMPTRGVYGRAQIEVSRQELGSTQSFRHYTVELKAFKPLDGDRYVTAMRGAYDQTAGDNVPFLERAILGGKNTLRGHGDNRFVDSSYLLFNVEERIRLFRYRLFNVNTDWEIAPFLDLGAVARNLLDMTTKNFVANPGLGFRAVVRPNVVGRVDIGFGSEGPAIFATLGYPF